MGKVVAITNQKGGGGKTTTAGNLSSCVAALGRRVLLIDLDPQGNSTSGFGISKRGISGSVYDLLCGENKLSQECLAGCGCDLMSDVLAFPKEHMCLLTGLTNSHVVRTCEMLDVVCIVFVRGKQPPADALELARELDIAVMSTSLTLYEACGKLYALGLPGKNTL